MDKKKSSLLGLLFCLFFVLPGCKKFIKEGSLDQAGIVLTFDDDRLDNWVKNLPLLDSMGVKATFYISNYCSFSTVQKNQLALLQSHGHEIAYHTLHHYNMEEYVSKSYLRYEEYVNKEIEAGLKLMNHDGFYPTTFAYPYGAHSKAFDLLLKKYFKSVRALNGTENFSKSLVTSENNDVLYGLDIDKSGKRSDVEIIDLLKAAKNNHCCAILVAHDIDTNKKLSITRDRLLKIISFVQQNGLRYYTASEVSN
ncbi:polysaccharide deacetylase family protein [soil metagenome]